MKCPRCGGATGIATAIRNDPEESTTGVCGACGNRWAAVACESRQRGSTGRCGGFPVARCTGCHQYRCELHMGRRGGLCKRCLSKAARAR